MITTRWDTLVELAKKLQAAERKSLQAAERRTRARVTMGNADWARKAEQRDRCIDRLSEELDRLGIWATLVLGTDKTASIRSFEQLTKMRGGLSWNPQDGNWYATVGGPSGHQIEAAGCSRMACSDDACEAIDELHGSWVAAGSPEQRAYTVEEREEIDRRIRARLGEGGQP